MDFLQAANERVVIYDGAMGTSIQNRDLGPEDFGGEEYEGCNELLVVTRPDVIADVHRSFLDVGCDVIETDTFGGFSTVLSEYGLADRAHELSFEAARIARSVADEYSTPDRPRWVAGSMGPGTKLPSLGHITLPELRDAYEESARAMLEGGVDVLLIETMMDLLIVKAAMQGCRRAMKAVGREVPLQVQVTIETTGRMLIGSEIGAALATLDPMRPDVIGLNCATGPREMIEHVRHLVKHARMPVSVIPNAGLPHVEGTCTVYDLSPTELADYHERFVSEMGVNVIGGCCGTTPEHLAAVVERCGGLTPAARRIEHVPSLSSTYSPVPIEQDTSYLIIGERTNANGSKKFREAMLDGDWDTCVQIARNQVAGGSHVLDLCVDYVGRDGAADMAEAASRFANMVSAPLVLDSTEPPVLQAGLEVVAGRSVLNSANLEDGDQPGSRADQVFELAREFGAAVVCLLIDEEGQARDVEWKLRVAHRLHEMATGTYGLEPADLIFDALTFPLSTGDDDLRHDGMATIEAIRRIKAELPGVHTTLGVSNISFGLKPAARHALNSVFLHECVQAGLDSAIVHPSKIRPLNRIPEEQREVCLDLIYDRRRFDDNGICTYDPLQELLAIFADVTVDAAVKEDHSDWPVDRRLSQRIIDGDRDGLEADLDEAMAEGIAPLAIINDVLLSGMKVVGELFGSGEMQLPFVLQSAETMKKAVSYLEPHMESADTATAKGKVVLATVKGDVHDIGKNLVDIIFTNNGYEVHNIGIKVPISDIIAKVAEVDADAVGMSGLLVKSTLIMRDNLEELNRLEEKVPVLLGGAALTRTYVEKDLREVYEGRLFYGKDAFEGLSTMDRLMDMKRSGVDDPEFGSTPSGRQLPKRQSQRLAEMTDVDLPDRSPEVTTDNEVFVPPFLGSQIIKGIPIDDIVAYVNETALFRNQWQYRPEAGESDAEFKDRIRVEFRQELAKARAADILIPQVAYGFYPANSVGRELIVYADTDRSEELARMEFPRQKVEPHLCIADFFRPLDSGEIDYVAFHVVTMGAAISEATARLFAEDRYGEYLKLHGLGVEMAEALAEYWHHRIREEWGFADEDGPSLAGLFRQKYRGGRYSFGYPACPDLEDNMTIARLLDADRIGVSCSEDTGFQYQPEQTTSAIICHHPRAKYFVAR